MSENVVVIYSGGMDSFTVLHKAIRDGKKVNGIKNQKDFDVYITVCMADEGFFAL